MLLYEWSQRWRIPTEAVKELKTLLGTASVGLPSKTPELSEAAISNLIRLEASKKGARLWRNNVGATYTREGAFIRYGLANESSQMNAAVKSADLIGIRPVLITQKMVGYTIGQFISREIKHSNWKYSGTDREKAQLKWAELILTLGGDACFANSEGTL